MIGDLQDSEAGVQASAPGVRLLIVLLPALVALLAHPRALGVGWIWDDHALVSALGGSDVLGVALGRYLQEYMRPLLMLNLALEIRSGSPLLTHGVNLALHAVAALGLGAWLRSEGCSPLAAMAAASLWASLPVHTEVVLWACARGDLLVAVSAVIGLRAVRTRSPGHAVLAGVCALIAALSLERGLMLAPALCLRAVWGRSVRASVPVLVSCGLAMVVWLGLRLAFLEPLPALDYLIEGSSRILLVSSAFASAATRSIWPMIPDLAVGVHQVPDTLAAPVLGGIAALSLALFLVRSRGPVALGLALWALLLVPSLHLVPLDVFPLHADRYLYVPWLGAALAVAAGLDRLGGSLRRPALLAVGALVLLGSVTSAWRGEIWLDEAHLFATLEQEAEPGNPQPAYVYGAHLAGLGRCDLAVPRFEEALVVLRAQGRLTNAARIAGRLAACRIHEDPEAAVLPLRAAAAQTPDEPWFTEQWARALFAAGRLEECLQVARRLEELHPREPAGPAVQSMASAALLDFEGAITALDRSRALAGASGPSPLRERLVHAEGIARSARARGEQRVLQELSEQWSPGP